ncbi:hypothetical protein QF002_000955 [Paraburkholderia youngii]
MADEYRDRTRVRFGAVEAYAKGHRRVVPVTGTRFCLSLQDARDARSASSPLLQLQDGCALDCAHLSTLLPSIGAATWLYSAAVGAESPRLETVSDGVRVSLSITDWGASEASLGEGELRGIAARMVVFIEYGG